MADLNFNPQTGFYSFMDAINKQAQSGNVLAQQRAAAMLADIQAKREDEKITAEIENNRLRTQAYAQQVAQSMLPKTKAENKKQTAEAALLEMQSRYPEIAAIQARSQNNPALFKEWINRPENETLKNIFGEESGPGVEAYMRGIMPGNVTKTEVADINRNARTATAEATGQFGLEKQRIANEGILGRQTLANQGRASQQATKPPSVDQVYAFLAQKKAQGIPLSQQELDVMAQIEAKYKAAQAQAAAAQTKPQINLKDYGVKTTTPAEERQRIEGGNTPQVPQGWTIK